jgi:hypothetical protein
MATQAILMTASTVDPSASPPAEAHGSPYGRLLAMTVLSFAAMYVLMYAMVDDLGNVYSNFNQLYMAGLMVAALVVIEVLLMWRSYGNRRANRAILGVGALALAMFFAFIRQQTVVTDRQFLKSMIPHHGGAILMCERAALRDVELRALCNDIIASQERQIAEMRAKLNRMPP